MSMASGCVGWGELVEIVDVVGCLRLRQLAHMQVGLEDRPTVMKILGRVGLSLSIWRRSFVVSAPHHSIGLPHEEN
jgi:hypothetical protein